MLKRRLAAIPIATALPKFRGIYPIDSDAKPVEIEGIAIQHARLREGGCRSRGDEECGKDELSGQCHRMIISNF